MLIILALLLFLVSPVVRASSQCRCQPGDACWPSRDGWKHLNESISGHLVRVYPIGHVCHEPFFDQASCNQLVHLQYDSNWRAEQPGRMPFMSNAYMCPLSLTNMQTPQELCRASTGRTGPGKTRIVLLRRIQARCAGKVAYRYTLQ